MKIETQKSSVKDPDGTLLLSDSTYYINGRGEISLLAPCVATKHTYEIYSPKGALLGHPDAQERYSTLEGAEARIYSVMGEVKPA